MKNEKAYQKAGLLALMCLLIGVVAPFFLSAGAGFAMAPFILLVGCVAVWFGSEKDRLWVERNF